MAERISVREFARRDGCNEKLVRRGIAEGRLARGDDGKVDSALVATGWRRGNAMLLPAQSAPADARADKPVRDEPIEARDDETLAQAAERIAAASEVIPALATSMAKKEHFLALLRQLEYREKDGELVELQLARSVLFEEARAARDAWLNWPARFAALIAAELEVEADRATEVLTAYVHKQLAALGEPSGRFDKV